MGARSLETGGVCVNIHLPFDRFHDRQGCLFDDRARNIGAPHLLTQSHAHHDAALSAPGAEAQGPPAAAGNHYQDRKSIAPRRVVPGRSQMKLEHAAERPAATAICDERQLAIQSSATRDRDTDQAKTTATIPINGRREAQPQETSLAALPSQQHHQADER